MDDQNVQRVAILRLRRWDEAPVVRIGKARHQGLGEREGSKVRVEVQFAGATARRLNDREDMLVVRPCRQFQKIGHLFLITLCCRP
jgi:antitoxin component of MazEF toxin-antitoxin module